MQCFGSSWRVRNLLVMVLRLNEFLKLAELIPTRDGSGQAPTFVTVCSEYSTPPMSSTMPVDTPIRCPECLCRKKFTTDSWWLKPIESHHPEHLQVARQKNLTIRSSPRCVEPAQHRVFNTNKNSLEDLDVLHYLEHLENVADSQSQSPLPPQLRTESFAGAGAPRSHYIAGPWERNTQSCLKTNLQYNPYYPFATREEYKYLQCGIQKKGMKTYSDNVLKEEDTALHFPSFKSEDGIQKLVASMPDDQALREWELHTLKYMRWNHNH